MDARTMKPGVYTRPGTAYYWCRYTGPDGGEQRESTKCKILSAAEAYRRQRVAEVAAGTWRPAKERSPSTVEGFFRTWIAAREDAGVAAWKDEKYRIETYALPKIGKLRLDLVRRAHLIDVMRSLPKHLSPRSQLHVYGALRIMFDEALAQEKIHGTPCVLRTKRGELPVKRDKDPRWRAAHRYTREEMEALLYDPRISEMRRAYYALLFLAGLRSSEAAGVLVSDYDRTREPLGSLLIATQDDGSETKTGVVREVPVHPALAAILGRWLLSGFAFMHGRPPRSTDFLVPSPKHRAGGALRPLTKKTLEWMKSDLAMLGLRTTGRGRHAARHTFISLAQTDGASRDILATITHDGTTDRRAIASYTVYPWPALCEAIQRLQVGAPKAPRAARKGSR